MKKAFEKYFEKLNKIYLEIFGTNPTVCYTKNLNQSLLISTQNKEGYVEWQPKKQTKEIDFESIEKKLKFSLCDELKNYYSTYLFLHLSGNIQNINLIFDPINSDNEIEKIILFARKHAENCFKNKQVLLLGIACIDDDDSFSIYYENQTNEIFCYDDDTKKKVKIDSSLKDIISNMNACI